MLSSPEILKITIFVAHEQSMNEVHLTIHYEMSRFWIVIVAKIGITTSNFNIKNMADAYIKKIEITINTREIILFSLFGWEYIKCECPKIKSSDKAYPNDFALFNQLQEIHLEMFFPIVFIWLSFDVKTQCNPQQWVVSRIKILKALAFHTRG